MVAGPFTEAQAAAFCNCKTDELCFGALGAVDELDKIRTIHDASINGVNAHIRKNSPEKTTAPTLMDGMRALHWLHKFEKDIAHGASGPNANPLMLLKIDVKAAHRRCKIQKNDWKYQVAQTKMGVWVNMVGTYGVASAQLRWGRLAAIFLRLLYYLFPSLSWAFVFVDDFLFILKSPIANDLAAAITATLLALGCPLSSTLSSISVKFNLGAGHVLLGPTLTYGKLYWLNLLPKARIHFRSLRSKLMLLNLATLNNLTLGLTVIMWSTIWPNLLTFRDHPLSLSGLIVCVIIMFTPVHKCP